MTCPKCQGHMQTFDRQGIHIEQCMNCRGIFLDRGELEQIISAEESHYGAPPPYPGSQPHGQPHQGGKAYPVPPPDSPRGYRGGYKDSPSPFGNKGHGYKDSPRPYGHGYKDSPRPYGGRRKKSFLEQLFD